MQMHGYWLVVGTRPLLSLKALLPMSAVQRFLPIGDEAPATAMEPKADITMATEIDLNVAEVPYKSGAVRYRYSRFISYDKTRWIRRGLFVEYNEEGLAKSESTYANGRLLRRILGATLMENGSKAPLHNRLGLQ